MRNQKEKPEAGKDKDSEEMQGKGEYKETQRSSKRAQHHNNLYISVAPSCKYYTWNQLQTFNLYHLGRIIKEHTISVNEKAFCRVVH